MAEIHGSHFSTLRMALSGALLLGTLTVLGMAALPQQLAHAAPPQSCQGPSNAMECNKFVFRGDTVKVKVQVGKDACTYTLTADNSSVQSDPDGKDTGRANGWVSGAKGKICAELLLTDGSYTSFDYTVKESKRGGKNK